MDYKKLSEQFPSTELKINSPNTDSSFFSVLSLQCFGEIGFTAKKGIESPLLDKKLDSFFSFAEDTIPDLLLTPEGAIPFNYLKKIISDKAQKLKYGRLWCLCCEGIPNDELTKYVNEHSSDGSLKIICDLDSLDEKRHVNTLWYLFKTQDKKLAIVIQLKTTPMKDPEFKGEADGLTTGKTIYIFDLANGTRNYFTSLICADVFGVDKNELFTQFYDKHLFVFNPQLNLKPKADSIIAFRNGLFSCNQIATKRYIGLNWAKGTTIKLDKKHKIKASGSAYFNDLEAIFGKTSKDKILEDKDVLSRRMEHHSKGVYYGYNDNVHNNMWAFSNKEHVLFFRIKKDHLVGAARNTTTNHDPYIVNIFQYDDSDGKWVEKEQCDINREWIDKNDIEKNMPFKCPEACDKSRCEQVVNDYFIALCFGEKCKEEIVAKNEIFNRTIISLDEESKKNQNRKLGRLSKLFELVEKGMPSQLEGIFSGFSYHFDRNCAERGSNQLFNAKLDQEKYPGKKGIVAIMLDDCEKKDVQTKYKNLYDSVHADIKGQILIYYSKCGDGFEAYLDPHNDPKMTKSNPNFTSDTTSIFGR